MSVHKLGIFFHCSSNQGQAGLVLVVFVLTIMGVVAISFLYQMRLENEATDNYYQSVKAEYLAQAGIERAIACLKEDNNEYDDLYEEWAEGFGEEMEGGEYILYPKVNWAEETSEEETEEENSDISDEEGKININLAGIDSANEGWTPFGLNLGSLSALSKKKCQAIIAYRYGPDRAPGKAGVDDDGDNKILERDGIDNDGDGEIDESGEGIDEPDEFCPLQPYGDDNPFDTIDEVRLVPGIGEVTFRKIGDFITIYSYDENKDATGRLRVNINSTSMSQISQTLQETGFSEKKADQVAVNIIDFIDEDNSPTEFNGKYGLEKTPYINEVMPFFTSSPLVASRGLAKGGVKFLRSKITEKLEETIGDKVKKGKEKLSEEIKKRIKEEEKELEKSVKRMMERKEQKRSFLPFFGEKTAWAEGGGEKIEIEIEVEWIELYNPYDTSCSLKNWRLQTSLKKVKLGGVMNPHSYKVIFNIVIKLPEKTIGKELLDNYADTPVLTNEKKCVVDKVSYENWGMAWRAFEKNDPRVRQFASSVPGGSPWFRNWFWMPAIGEGRDKDDLSSFYIKNHPLSNVGEIGYIHTGEQWKTIKLEQGGDWRILDKITIVDHPEQPTQGRININTASSTVLQSLPGIDATLAKAIINYGETKGKRPFNQMGEILEILPLEKLAYNGIDDDRDGYIDEEDEKEIIFRSLSNLICVRSNCFTLICEGRAKEGKEILAEKKIKVIVDRGKNPIKIKYYREL